MSIDAIRELEAEVSGTDFVALEQKVYRTIELLKTAREGRAEAQLKVEAAERKADEMAQLLTARQAELETARQQVAELRETLDVRQVALEAAERQVADLRREREDVRTRVEKILKQIDQLSEEETAR